MATKKKGPGNQGPVVRVFKGRPKSKIVFQPTLTKLALTPPKVVIDEVVTPLHDRNLNLANFSLYLVGTPKQLDGTVDQDTDEPGVEYQMVSQFIKNLDVLSHLDPRRPILIHMKTCGGDYTEGMAIYDAIRACPNPVSILSYTHARSMSSIIIQAADKRVLMPHSYFMIHEGGQYLGGTHKFVQTWAEWGKEVAAKTMLDIYIESMKKNGKFRHFSPDRIRTMLQDEMDKKQDKILTPQEAVEWGLADKVFGADGVYDWADLRKF